MHDNENAEYLRQTQQEKEKVDYLQERAQQLDCQLTP